MKIIKFKPLCYFILFMSVLFIPSYAQNVVPSERVSNKVNIREYPNAQSTIIGSIKKGESAKLIETIPYWYKIEFNNDSGYVSKAWTNLADESVQSDSTKKTDLIIGSWNIKWFGHYTHDEHDYNEIAKIIQKMDVVAVQELQGNRSQNRIDTLIKYLANNGFKYKFAISDETGYINNPDTLKGDYLEKYCFLWDIDRVNIINPNSPIKFVKTPIINNSTFRQVPIIADFKVINGNGFDFRMLTIHTVYSKNISEVRKNEIQFLNDWIIQQVKDSSNNEKNIIVIGDFNANPDGQPHYFNDIVSGTNNYRVLFEEPLSAGESSERTTIIRSNNPGQNENLLPVYDQALISNETSYALPHKPMKRSAKDLGVVEFDRDNKWIQLNNWDKVVRAMSDHRPIWFRLDYNAVDKD